VRSDEVLAKLGRHSQQADEWLISISKLIVMTFGMIVSSTVFDPFRKLPNRNVISRPRAASRRWTLV
jgi:hypothetical protein